jgi:hypothetical protein
MSAVFKPCNAAAKAFRSVMADPVELAPICHSSGNLTVYKGVSNGACESHFSHVAGRGWHVSTYLNGSKVDQVDL